MPTPIPNNTISVGRAMTNGCWATQVDGRFEIVRDPPPPKVEVPEQAQFVDPDEDG
jgi:hypothetical protein